MLNSAFTKSLIYQSMLGAFALAATISISESAQAKSCPVRMDCPSWDNFVPGSSQWNPILPNRTEREWFIFDNVRSNLFIDPPTTYGFQYVMTSESWFTQILNFPIGIDGDNLFGVSVGNTKIGQFGPGDSVNFIDLLGGGVSEFTITGIDSLIDPDSPTAFPVQLAYSTETASLKMRALEEPKSTSVPEPTSVLGILAIGSGLLLKCKLNLSRS